MSVINVCVCSTLRKCTKFAKEAVYACLAYCIHPSVDQTTAAR